MGAWPLNMPTLRRGLQVVLAVSGMVLLFSVDTTAFSNDFARALFGLQFWFCLGAYLLMGGVAVFGSQSRIVQSVKGTCLLAFLLLVAVAYFYLEKRISIADIYQFLQALCGILCQLYIWPLLWLGQVACQRLQMFPLERKSGG